jgi:hypothetical protein
MLRRIVARKLRSIADFIEPPTATTLFNRRKNDSVRSPEEQLDSIRQMAEARNVMQMFENQVALIQHHQRHPSAPHPQT